MRYLILLYICIFVLVSCSNRKRQTPIDEYMKSVFEYIGSLEEQTQGASINDQPVYYGNDSLTATFLSSLPLEDILFFYFSEQTCIPCINMTIDALNEHFTDYTTNENIIFISPDFPARLRDDCYGKRLLSLHLGSIGLSLEEMNVPFFFTVNRDMEVSSIHVVIKENMDRTSAFLKSFIDSRKNIGS